MNQKSAEKILAALAAAVAGGVPFLSALLAAGQVAAEMTEEGREDVDDARLDALRNDLKARQERINQA